MKIGFVSLGCPKNQLDTEVMLHEVVSAGYEITPDETEADVVVVNTCAFIESAKREAIDNILDVAWLKKHRSLRAIIVTGCLAERYGKEIFTELPEVDAVLGVGSIHHIVEAIRAVTAKLNKGEKKQKFYSHDDRDAVALGGDRVLTTPDFAAYLKIAEGCDNRCTYCAIPNIRGKFRSRPMEELVAEAQDLERLGVKELTLIAQDVTRYGQDLYGRYALAELIRKITAATAIPWLRILYCYPDKITDELIAELRENPRLVKYIDLPLQHVNDRILRRMNRRGDSALIREVLAKLRREVPGIVIRTTFIVGFPGESNAEFEELCTFVKEQKFDHAGAFAYSREEDTPAYDFPDQIEEQTKQDRLDILMREQGEVNEELNRAKIGAVVRVLCEGYDPAAGIYYGRSEADAPEIDGKVYFRSQKPVEPGAFVSVKVTEALDYDLSGDVIPETE